MANHSSVLAWRIPGTGEPGELPSYGVAQSQTRLKWLSSSSMEVELISMPMVGVCFPGDELRIRCRKQEGTSRGVPRTSWALMLPTEFPAEPGSIWLDAKPKYKLLLLFMLVKSRVFNWLASMSAEMGKRPDDWSRRARIWYIGSHYQQWVDSLLGAELPGGRCCLFHLCFPQNQAWNDILGINPQSGC